MKYSFTLPHIFCSDMIQIWQAEDVDGCVCIDTILSLCILKTLCGPLCLTGEQWPSWHTGAFCFFYACVTLLYFETFVARVALVLFFLSSAFSAFSLSVCRPFSLLLQNTWGNTWSRFVLGTGGVISQRSLCWCLRVRVRQRIHEFAGSWAGCPLCVQLIT